MKIRTWKPLRDEDQKEVQAVDAVEFHPVFYRHF